MISYELAKELHDASFPQIGTGKRIAPPDKIVARRHDFVYVPTLDELIEACGPHFFSLVYDLGKGWRCFSDTDQWNTVATSDGSTPAEAVARLWLALNKN